MAFQQNGVLPKAYSSVSTNDLGSLGEESLIPQIKNALTKTNESEFSEPILLGSDYHIFYVKKKDLVESQDYLEKKNEIHAELFTRSITSIAASWFKTEVGKHYVKYFF